MSRREEDYREFVDANAARLHRTAYLLCGDWHLANDLVAQTLVKAFRQWRRVRWAENPSSLVHRIMVAEFKRYWHRHRDLPVRADDGHEAIVADVPDGVVNRADLLRALLRLPTRQRIVVVLRYLEGMSEAETAAVLRCGDGAVRSQTAQAMNALGGHLKHKELPI
ncbi:MAG TPA: sigma-70 family RNA polymerase sigma factor [Pseudonocardiaceae bacterium]|jgi:RNA polymerase sigma-70 factor (sigma-E family)